MPATMKGACTTIYIRDADLYARLLGIGRMLATALAENGAQKVFIIGRREEKLKEVAAKFPE